MIKLFSIAIRTAVVTIILCSAAYPLVVTGIGQLLFPSQAHGSLVTDAAGKVVGSELIGQPFSNPGYFWSRPSTSGDNGYGINNADNKDGPFAASGGSNYGTTNKKLQDRAKGDLDKLKDADPQANGAPPVDLLTTSASGLDPDITIDAAVWQLPRVATARKVAPDRLRPLVAAAIKERQFGLLGEPRVNVLQLNLALDRQFGAPTPVPAAPAAAPAAATPAAATPAAATAPSK